MTEKRYFIPADSPVIAQFEKVLNHVAIENKGLLLNVNPEIVQDGNTDMTAYLMAAAQHNPAWINGLVFGIDFNFKKIEDTEINYSVNEWAGLQPYRSWFAKMGASLPMAMFFLKNWEARFYSITGDLVNNGNVQMIEDNNGLSSLSFPEEDLKTIYARVGEGCQLFMDYCYGTGFDPRPAIETVIAEFQVNFSYEKVEEVFQKNLTEGVHYSMNFG